MVTKMDDGFVKDIYTPVLHRWKAFKTIWSPAMHVRNPISNMFLNHLGGLPFWRTDVYARAVKEIEIKTFGKAGRGLFNEAKELGLFKQSLVVGELGILADDIAQGTKKGFINYIGKRFNQTEKKLGRMFEKEEHIAKYAKYIFNREELGMSKLDAVNDAMKWTFNYSELPQAIKKARNFIPFITFPYKALQVTSEALVNTPWRLHSIVYPFLGFAHANITAAKMTEKDFDDLYLQLPEYMQKGRFFLLPWKDEQNRMQWIDVGYMLPWGDIVNGDGILQLDSFAKQNPFISIAEDLRRNRDWLDRPIWNDWDTPDIKTFKKVEHIWTSVLPSLAGRDIKNLTKTIAGEPKARTPAQLAAATLVGAKITPRSKQEIRVDAMKRKMAKRGELKRWFNKEMRKPLGAKERIDTQEDYRKALRDILKRG